MAQFLYRIVPTRTAMLTDGPTDEEQRIVGEHFSYLQNLVERGIVLMAGRTMNRDERTFGIVIFQAADDTQARSLMHDDPAVRHGVMRAELFPYSIALWSNAGPVQE